MARGANGKSEERNDPEQMAARKLMREAIIACAPAPEATRGCHHRVAEFTLKRLQHFNRK